MKNRKKIISVIAGIMAFLILFGLVASILPGLVSAESLSTLKDQLAELEDKKEAVNSQIAQLQSQMNDNYEEMTQAVKQKSLIDQEIALLYQQIATINEQLSAFGLLIAEKVEELERAQERQAELSEQNRGRIRAMEENGKLSYWSVLFKANSFADFLDRLKMIEEIERADQRRMKEMKAAADAVAEAKEALEAEKAALEATREELDNTQRELEVRRAQADELLNDLVRRGAEFDAVMEESEAQQEELMQQIAQKKDDIKDAEYEQWLSTSVPSGGSAGTGNTVGGVEWLLPMTYTRVTSKFGPRTHPITGEKGKMHNGVDLAADSGTPIYATRSGYVSTAAYEEGGAGYYVQINHGDGFRSIYMHMTHFVVRWGQYVQAGQLIGYCGSTGGSTGPHLHFGISYNGSYVNPANYIPI